MSIYKIVINIKIIKIKEYKRCIIKKINKQYKKYKNL